MKSETVQILFFSDVFSLLSSWNFATMANLWQNAPTRGASVLVTKDSFVTVIVNIYIFYADTLNCSILEKHVLFFSENERTKGGLGHVTQNFFMCAFHLKNDRSSSKKLIQRTPSTDHILEYEYQEMLIFI